MFFFIGSNMAYAEYNESELKNLFTNKQLREEIDAKRTGKYRSSKKGPVTQVKVNGYMKRSGGKNVVWVNGKSTMNSSRVGGVTVFTQSITKSNKVPLRVDGRKIYVRPGEVWKNGSVSPKNKN